MKDELYRSETAICSLSSNSLAWDTWAHDALTALGMAAIRNRLGDALLHFIDSPQSFLVQQITLMVSTKLIHRGHDKRNTLDAAFQAFEYWNSRHCLYCNGRGVLNFQQDECPRCGGTGERPVPSEYADMIKDGISILIEAENYMERQLRARMAPAYIPDHKYELPEKLEQLEVDNGIGNCKY